MIRTLDRLEKVLQGLKFEKSQGYYNDGKTFSYQREFDIRKFENNKIYFYKLSCETRSYTFSYFRFCVYVDGKITSIAHMEPERTITDIDIFDVPSIIMLYGNM